MNQRNEAQKKASEKAPATPLARGPHRVEAWRWFGRGRVLAQELVTGFTAPVLGLLPNERAQLWIEDGLLRDGTVLLESLENPSPWRVKPPCSQAAICPGCAMQHVSEEGRSDYARTLILEVLERFAGFASPPEPDIVMGVAGDHRVRTKVWLRRPAFSAACSLSNAPDGDATQSAFDGAPGRGIASITSEEAGATAESKRQWEVGMRQRGTMSAPLVDFSQCIANAPLLRQAVTWLQTLPLMGSTWDAWNNESPSLELELVAHTLQIEADAWPMEQRTLLLEHMRVRAEESAALQSVELVQAERPWTHVNPSMQERLYDKALQSLDWAGKTVFDLTCGDGGLSFHLAAAGAQVFASDRHWPSVQRTAARAAFEAERSPELPTVQTRGGDALAVLTGAKKRGEKVDIVVINPMREPVGESTMHAVHESGATELFYLAPAPKAGAKDLATLASQGWMLTQCAAIDLHPWTGQLMMLAVLRRPAAPDGA